MLINEVIQQPEIDPEKLEIMVLADQQRGELQGQGHRRLEMPIQSFLELIRDLGISYSDSQLRADSQKPPLSGVIKDVQGDSRTGRVIFRGSDSTDTTPTLELGSMTPPAQQLTSAMATSAARRDL